MSVKQGSVMEGIFAMYCAGLLIDPNHGKSHGDIESFINELRVDTTLGKLEKDNSLSVDYFNTFPTDNKQGPSRRFKGVSVVTGTKAKQMITASPTKSNEIKKEIKNSDNYFETLNVQGIQDFSQVELKVRVKEAETGALYGSNLSKLNKIIDDEVKKTKKLSGNVKNYVDIKKKMLTLIESKHTSFFKTLTTKKINFIKNSKSDIVKWTVDADGIAGEVSKGEIKQDVTIDITANGKKLVHETLNFSLKSDSVSIHGGGLYDGIADIYDMFKGFVSASDVQKTKTWLAKINGEESDAILRKDALNALWRFLGSNIPSQPDYKLSERFWDILEKRLYGTGYQGNIQVLEMKKNEIREIDKPNFERLRRTGIKLSAKWIPNKSPSEATPGSIFIVPTYPNGNKVEMSIGGRGDKSMYKMRISYEWIKQTIGGVKKRYKKEEGGVSSPLKAFIELGGADSIIHDENWTRFVKEGLIGAAPLLK